MDKKEAISKLAGILRKYGYPESFLQIMDVYEKVKPGFLFQTEKSKMLYDIIERPVKELDLFITPKHGLYVTYDPKRFRSWKNPISYKLKGKQLGSFYLGYPKCCEFAFNSHLVRLFGFHTYYILKKALADKDSKALKRFKTFFKDLMELEEYGPCVVGCPETHKRAVKFRAVRKKYSSFLPSGYIKRRKKEAKEFLIENLELVKSGKSRKLFRKELPLIKKNAKTFHLRKDFFKEIESLLENPNSKKELISKELHFVKGL